MGEDNMEQRATIVLRILRQEFTLPKWVKQQRDPFETMVTTVLSQNTADKNTARAFEALSKRFEITPEALAKADLGEIEDAIKVSGLYKSKAKTIRKAAITVLEKCHGTLNPILSLPLEEARKTLIQFPGVGPKTADVILLFSASQPTIPIDTHVNRLAKRLEFAPAKGDYEAVRKSLQALYTPSQYLAVHLLLIAHGRRYCKARKPLCNVCPVNACCPSKGKWNNHD
jgi:endonuclease-3